MIFTTRELMAYFEYLDNLRTGGTTNMLNAPRLMIVEFDMTDATAHKAFALWAATFDEVTERMVRVAQAVDSQHV